MDNTAQVIAALRGLLQSHALGRTQDEDQWKEAERALLAYDAEQALKLSAQIPQELLVGTQTSDQGTGHRPVTSLYIASGSALLVARGRLWCRSGLYLPPQDAGSVARAST